MKLSDVEADNIESAIAYYRERVAKYGHVHPHLKTTLLRMQSDADAFLKALYQADKELLAQGLLRPPKP